MPTSFTLGGTTVTFSRSPARPPQSSRAAQPQEQSTGREPVAGSVAWVDDEFVLVWQGMKQSEAIALQAFFRNIAQGAANPITWVDVAGTSRTVRFVDPSIDMPETAYDRCAVTVRLRKA